MRLRRRETEPTVVKHRYTNSFLLTRTSNFFFDIMVVADNLVYQNFPAIVFGFPMMLLATLAPQKPILTFVILVVFFVVMNVILFREQIFKRNK